MITACQLPAGRALEWTIKVRQQQYIRGYAQHTGAGYSLTNNHYINSKLSRAIMYDIRRLELNAAFILLPGNYHARVRILYLKPDEARNR